MLDEAGFDTLESLTLPISEFRDEVTGMKAGHARALLNMVDEERERIKPRKLDMSGLIEQGTPPVPVSTGDNSIEKRALAGNFPNDTLTNPLQVQESAARSLGQLVSRGGFALG